ncbi:MAG: hypothetical protein GX122_00550 [Candidatus Cloacimonetes bacterium]|nr:hypothetical protein [Candidatus Cloacimonadota bacterium]NLO10911.1 hypothetical protein [Candidatus Cloacimonadota bacterium]
MTKKISLIFIVGLMLFGLFFAQNPNLVERPKSKDTPQYGIDALFLSQAQKDAINTIEFNHQKQMIDLKAAVDKANLDIQQAIRKENFADAKKHYATLFNKMKEMADARMDLMQAVLKELNDQQKLMMKAKDEHFDFSGWESYGIWGGTQWMQGVGWPGVFGQRLGMSNPNVKVTEESKTEEQLAAEEAEAAQRAIDARNRLIRSSNTGGTYIPTQGTREQTYRDSLMQQILNKNEKKDEE